MPLVAGALYALLALDLGREEDVRRVLDAVRTSSRDAFEVAAAILDGELVRAADLLAAGGERSSEALVRLRAARRFAAEGSRAEASAQLAAALAFYRSVGATRYIREGDSCSLPRRSVALRSCSRRVAGHK